MQVRSHAMKSFKEYQRACAYWGHIQTPLTQKEYRTLASKGFDYSELLAISDDIAGGWTIAESIKALKESQGV